MNTTTQYHTRQRGPNPPLCALAASWVSAPTTKAHFIRDSPSVHTTEVEWRHPTSCSSHVLTVLKGSSRGVSALRLLWCRVPWLFVGVDRSWRSWEIRARKKRMVLSGEAVSFYIRAVVKTDQSASGVFASIWLAVEFAHPGIKTPNRPVFLFSAFLRGNTISGTSCFCWLRQYVSRCRPTRLG